MNLLNDYQEQALRTQAFCRRLAASNLLVKSSARIELPDGSNFRLSGMHVLDQTRLQMVDKKIILELFTSGELALIYAHLLSMGNLQRLLEKLTSRQTMI